MLRSLDAAWKGSPPCFAAVAFFACTVGHHADTFCVCSETHRKSAGPASDNHDDEAMEEGELSDNADQSESSQPGQGYVLHISYSLLLSVVLLTMCFILICLRMNAMV